MDNQIQDLEMKFKEAVNEKHYITAREANDILYDLQYDLYQRALKDKRIVILSKPKLEERIYNEQIRIIDEIIDIRKEMLESHARTSKYLLRVIELEEDIDKLNPMEEL